MAKKKLTLTTISGNESKWVKQFCESFLPVVDHFVINLTQFDDDTEELLRQYIPAEKLTLIKNPWEKSFSLARNQGLKYIPEDTDYCLYADMDEVLTKDSYPYIEKFLTEIDHPVLGLVTIYNSLEQKGLLASLFYPRIWPTKDKNGKKLDVYFEGSVHNQLMIDRSIPAVRLRISLMHYGYALSKEDMAKKHKRSEELLRNQISADNNDFFSHINLAQLLRAKGDFEGCIYHAKEVLRIIQPNLDNKEDGYYNAYIMAKDQLATGLCALGNYSEGLQHSQDVLRVKSDHLDSLMSSATAYMGMGDLEKAEFWYKRYLFIHSRYDETRDFSNIILNHLNSTSLAQYNLGIIRAMKNDLAGATEYFKKAYYENPDFLDSFIKFIHALKLQDRQKEFSDEVGQFLTKYSDKAYIVYNYFADIALDEGNIELAKFNYYQATNLVPKEERQKYSEKYNSIINTFGPVSNTFFESAQKAKQRLDKVE